MWVVVADAVVILGGGVLNGELVKVGAGTLVGVSINTGIDSLTGEAGGVVIMAWSTG